MKNDRIPVHIPCPVCGQWATVYPLICKFADDEIVPLICHTCISIAIVRETPDPDTWEVSQATIGQQEILLEMINHDRAWENAVERVVKHTDRDRSEKRRWN